MTQPETPDTQVHAVVKTPDRKTPTVMGIDSNKEYDLIEFLMNETDLGGLFKEQRKKAEERDIEQIMDNIEKGIPNEYDPLEIESIPLYYACAFSFGELYNCIAKEYLSKLTPPLYLLNKGEAEAMLIEPREKTIGHATTWLNILHPGQEDQNRQTAEAVVDSSIEDLRTFYAAKLYSAMNKIIKKGKQDVDESYKGSGRQP